MNLRKKASVLLTLAVAFMMLVVPLSTSLGGGVQENRLRYKHIILQLNHIESKFFKMVQEGSS